MLAAAEGISIFGQGVEDGLDDTMYRLHGVVKKHLDMVTAKIKRSLQEDGKVVFPVKLKILKLFVKTSGFVILGVLVQEGQLRLGTPIGIQTNEFQELGHVSCIQGNSQALDCAVAGSEVGIKIMNPAIQFGRHGFIKDAVLIPRMTAESSAVLDDFFHSELCTSDRALLCSIKSFFKIC